MNNHFMLLLRKDDIIDFFNYGRWNAQCPKIKFDGDLKKLAQDGKLMGKLFKQSNPFGYSMDFFLVHVVCAKISAIDVDDILDIFALDKESFKIGLSLSPEINLREPIFESHYTDFQITNEVNEAKRGIRNIFSIFDIEQPKSLFKKGELEDIIHDSFLDIKMEGDHSLWYYLLRYERHQSYPKDNRGFFLDAIHAFYNYGKKQYMDVNVSGSKVGKFVIQQPEDIKYNNLVIQMVNQIDFLKKSEKAQKGFYRIAPLFLWLKDTFIDGVHENNTYCNMKLTSFINAVKNSYDKKDLSTALYLLGVVLGRKNTYQYIYKKNKLPILK